MDPVLRFFLLALLPLAWFALLLNSYLWHHPPRWRALLETVLPPLVFLRKPVFDFGRAARLEENGWQFLRLCFTLGCLWVGGWTAIDMLVPKLAEVPWVLGAVVGGLAANAVLNVTLTGVQRLLLRGGDTPVASHEWRMKATGSFLRAATQEEIYELKYGEGSWRARQNRLCNFVAVCRVVLWVACVMGPVLILFSRGMSVNACSLSALLLVVVGSVVSFRLARD